MKKFALSFIWIMIILIGCSTHGNGSDECELIWSDEFEGSVIDWSMWSKTPRGKSNWCDAMSNADELLGLIIK